MLEFTSIPSLLESINEQVFIKHLEKIIWKGKPPVSPFDPNSKVYRYKNGKYRCKNTSKYFTIKTGTIFENSKLPLWKWFYALHLYSGHKKGISSHRIAKEIKTTQTTLETFIRDNVEEGSTIYTDRHHGYNGLWWWYEHRAEKYVNGKASTNRIESAWASPKRSVCGIYHRVSPKHLPRYVCEWVFRHNTRNYDDEERFDLLLASAVGKRLTYESLIRG